MKKNIHLRPRKTLVRNPTNQYVSIVIRQVILLMFVEVDPLPLMDIGLMHIMNIILVPLMFSATLETNMDIELLSAGLE